MSFTNIKAKNQGFTIVELLIVVVVIAILAAITIVSYNGITNRANASGAKSAAATLQKKVEAYMAEEGKYPVTTNLLTSAASDKSYALPASIFPDGANATAFTSKNGSGSAKLYVCHGGTGATTSANIAGIQISYWDYEASTKGETPSAQRLSAGTTTTCNLAAAS